MFYRKIKDKKRCFRHVVSAIKCVFPSKVKNVKSKKLFVINGIKSTKPNEIDDGFWNYFSSVVSILKQILYSLIDFTWGKLQYLPLHTYKWFHFGYVSVTDVTQLPKKLKHKKATGNDNLLPSPLKFYLCTKMVLPINLEITAQYQFYP